MSPVLVERPATWRYKRLLAKQCGVEDSTGERRTANGRHHDVESTAKEKRQTSVWKRTSIRDLLSMYFSQSIKKTKQHNNNKVGKGLQARRTGSVEWWEARVFTTEPVLQLMPGSVRTLTVDRKVWNLTIPVGVCLFIVEKKTFRS